MHKSEFARTDAAAAKVHSNFQILPNSLFTPHHSPLEGVYIRLQGGGGCLQQVPVSLGELKHP